MIRLPHHILRKLSRIAAMPRRRRWISRLTLRIFAVNVMALIVLVFGLLYVSRYQQELVSGELEGLERQAQIYAGAVAEAARYSSIITTPDPAIGQLMRDSLSRERTRNMVRRLGETTVNRIRVYDDTGRLMGDSDVLGGAGGVIRAIPLPPPTIRAGWALMGDKLLNATIDLLPSGIRLQTYPEENLRTRRRAPEFFPDIEEGLEGRLSSTAWRSGEDHNDIILSAAAPIQHLKQVLGTVYVTRDGATISESIRQMKLDILRLFGVALALTFVLSLYLAAGIAKPLRRLARAAEQVHRGQRRAEIPDLTQRRDEIGDLSLALREMTGALAARLDTIERFAADVSHELKNPLTSLRSAIETVQMVKDKRDQDKLMAIILHDLQRMDRLITDISGASRLDAELSRENMGLVDLRMLLRQMVEAYESPLVRMRDSGENEVDEPQVENDAQNIASANRRILLSLPGPEQVMIVQGLEGRLVQVFRNLIDNALSFSPAGQPVRIRAVKDTQARQWRILFEDSGPGIPESKLLAIFDRFYSERPSTEAFGKHSGLGLSIAKQIMDAHKGTLYAENIQDEQGQRLGARFVVCLDALG